MNILKTVKSASTFAITCTTAGMTILVLTGCSQQSAVTLSPEKTKTPITSESPIASPSATATPNTIETDPSGNGISCEAIIPPQNLYELNPNLALIPDVKLGLTEQSKLIEGLGGISCQISNLSTSSDVEITVIKLTAASGQKKNSDISNDASLLPQAIGEDLTGYFNSINGVGQLQFVSKNFWVDIASTNFTDGIQASAYAAIVKSHLTN